MSKIQKQIEKIQNFAMLKKKSTHFQWDSNHEPKD